MSASELPAGLVEQMAALIRDLHADHTKHGAHDYVQDFVARTAAIVSVLPKPVDPDLIEARTLVECIVHWSPQTDRDLASGKNDSTPEVRIALAALKRGRLLESRGKAES